MQRYVAGFLMYENWVYLVRKNRPQHLAGKLNGIGGKVELEETADVAMMREFLEETRVCVAQWNHFCRLQGNYALNGAGSESPFEIHFYYAVASEALHHKLTPRSNDVGEAMNWQYIDDLLFHPREADLMPNCTWLIPMALSLALGERATSFVVTEQYVR